MTSIERCPACGSADRRIRGFLGAGFSTEVARSVFVQPEFQTYQCEECGLIYKSSVLSPEELSRYYQLVDYKKWEIEGLFPNERLVLAHLKTLPENSWILDIGCSSGRLLSRLTDRYRCFGMEPNLKAAAEAQAKGIEMLGQNDWPGNESNSKFDAIVLVDVFEHLSDPMQLLSQASARLKPGGRLLICTGDGDSKAFRDDPGNSWYFRNVEHLIMMTQQFAHHVAAKLKFELQVYESCTHYDIGFVVRMRQHIQHFAFHQFRNQKILSRFLRFMPVIRRAASWEQSPTVSCTRDHVVAILKKT